MMLVKYCPKCGHIIEDRFSVRALPDIMLRLAAAQKKGPRPDPVYCQMDGTRMKHVGLKVAQGVITMHPVPEEEDP